MMIKALVLPTLDWKELGHLCAGGKDTVRSERIRWGGEARFPWRAAITTLDDAAQLTNQKRGPILKDPTTSQRTRAKAASRQRWFTGDL